MDPHFNWEENVMYHYRKLDNGTSSFHMQSRRRKKKQKVLPCFLIYNWMYFHFDIQIHSAPSGGCLLMHGNNFFKIASYFSNNINSSSFFHNDKQELELKQFDRGDFNFILQSERTSVLVSLNFNCYWYVAFSNYTIMPAWDYQLADDGWWIP